MRYSTIAILHTSHFTVAHALGFSVFISRILAKDLPQSHCHLNAHMKAFWHSLIPFLQFILNHFRLTSPETDPILILVRVKVKVTLLAVYRQSPLRLTTSNIIFQLNT
jgi:hypothetical protein